jgi:hypothetical protein
MSSLWQMDDAGCRIVLGNREKGRSIGSKMKHQPGERAGAILGTRDDGSIDFLGYGVYEGDFVPDDGPVGPFVDLLREEKIPNPRLRLDDGNVVYGIECWWGTEEAIKKRLEERIVNIVSIVDIRAKYKKEEGKDGWEAVQSR